MCWPLKKAAFGGHKHGSFPLFPQDPILCDPSGQRLSRTMQIHRSPAPSKARPAGSPPAPNMLHLQHQQAYGSPIKALSPIKVLWDVQELHERLESFFAQVTHV